MPTNPSPPSGRPSLNKAWHAAHRMPPRATLDQRIAWHRAHAEACGCRPAPPSIRPHLEPRVPRRG